MFLQGSEKSLWRSRRSYIILSCARNFLHALFTLLLQDAPLACQWSINSDKSRRVTSESAPGMVGCIPGTSNAASHLRSNFVPASKSLCNSSPLCAECAVAFQVHVATAFVHKGVYLGLIWPVEGPSEHVGRSHVSWLTPFLLV